MFLSNGHWTTRNLSKRSSRNLPFANSSATRVRKPSFLATTNCIKKTYGVSMSGSLGPVLANIIMTETEQETVNKLINQGLIALYCRYVDDTLLLIKCDTITTILEHFHKVWSKYPLYLWLLYISKKIALRTFWTSISLMMVLASIEKILLLRTVHKLWKFCTLTTQNLLVQSTDWPRTPYLHY